MHDVMCVCVCVYDTRASRFVVYSDPYCTRPVLPTIQFLNCTCADDTATIPEGVLWRVFLLFSFKYILYYTILYCTVLYRGLGDVVLVGEGPHQRLNHQSIHRQHTNTNAGPS